MYLSISLTLFIVVCPPSTSSPSFPPPSLPSPPQPRPSVFNPGHPHLCLHARVLCIHRAHPPIHPPIPIPSYSSHGKVRSRGPVLSSLSVCSRVVKHPSSAQCLLVPPKSADQVPRLWQALNCISRCCPDKQRQTDRAAQAQDEWRHT